MRFCANPRCRFHAFRVKSAGQPLVVNTTPASSVEACACKQILHHHPYHDPAGNPADRPVYFCDVCHRAIEMALQQGLRPVGAGR